MPRQVIVWERRLPIQEVTLHLNEAAEWVHNRIRELANVGYLVEEAASVSVSESSEGQQTLTARAIMNTETGKRLIRR